MKRHYLPALVASFVVVACAANEDLDFLAPTEPSDEDGGTNAVVLPPPSSGESDGGDVVVDSGSGGPGKPDASTPDAAKDSGVASPTPGAACTTQDQIGTR